MLKNNLDLKAYIESGAIESYLLGLSTPEEEALLERMRHLYPELNFEISATEYRLEQAARTGAMTPPARVWDHISQQVNWQPPGEGKRSRKRPEEAAYTFINLQHPPQGRYIQVSIWWRCAFIALCMLVMALLASTVYFYKKYHELEERVLRAYPAAQPAPAPTK